MNPNKDFRVTQEIPQETMQEAIKIARVESELARAAWLTNWKGE